MLALPALTAQALLRPFLLIVIVLVRALQLHSRVEAAGAVLERHQDKLISTLGARSARAGKAACGLRHTHHAVSERQGPVGPAYWQVALGAVVQGAGARLRGTAREGRACGRVAWRVCVRARACGWCAGHSTIGMQPSNGARQLGAGAAWARAAALENWGPHLLGHHPCGRRARSCSGVVVSSTCGLRQSCQRFRRHTVAECGPKTFACRAC